MSTPHNGRVVRVTTFLCAALMALPGGIPVVHAAGQDDPALVKQQVQAFGVRAKVIYTLTTGDDGQGVIRSIGDSSFVVEDQKLDRPTTVIDYREVRTIRLRTTQYSSRYPDAAEVRRVLMDLGVGAVVSVTTTRGAELRGTIRSVGSDSFTILVPILSTTVAYGDVLEVKPRMSKAKKNVLITAGVVGGILGLALLIALSQAQ